MDESDTNARIQQLYSLFQPHAANAHALLDRWNQEPPLDAARLETTSPDAFSSLVKHLSELPVGEVAALLEGAIAADKEGEAAPNLKQMSRVLSKLEAQVRSAAEETQAFAKKRPPLPTPLPSELGEALKREEARLEQSLAAAQARMLTKKDLQLLRKAKVPRKTIDRIVRDAPTEAQIEELTAQLDELRGLSKASADGHRFSEQLDPLEVLADTSRDLLGPILDPMLWQQVQDFAQPIVEPDERNGG